MYVVSMHTVMVLIFDFCSIEVRQVSVLFQQPSFLQAVCPLVVQYEILYEQQGSRLCRCLRK